MARWWQWLFVAAFVGGLLVGQAIRSWGQGGRGVDPFPSATQMAEWKAQGLDPNAMWTGR